MFTTVRRAPLVVLALATAFAAACGSDSEPASDAGVDAPLDASVDGVDDADDASADADAAPEDVADAVDDPDGSDAGGEDAGGEDAGGEDGGDGGDAADAADGPDTADTACVDACERAGDTSCADGDVAVCTEVDGCLQVVVREPCAGPCVVEDGAALCLAATCDNDALDDDEADVDCGGACLPCALESSCGEDADCVTSVCRRGVCVPEHCGDGEQSGDEPSPDCGGACGTCVDGTGCINGAACESGVCESRVCSVPDCADEVANGDETDIDCGGPCDPCADRLGCAVADDCISGVCGELQTCVPPRCGDGVLHEGEECDAGAGNSDEIADACRTDCSFAHCGDGVRDAGEECDDGNELDIDACTTLCTAAACGDGFVERGVEECDDGNDVDDDACRNGCVAAACGDGVLYDGVEECDDGNEVDGDGCSGCYVDACPDAIVEASFAAIGDAIVSGDTCAVGNDLAAPRCSESATGGDYTFAYTAPADGLYAFDLDNDTRGFDTVLFVSDTCGGEVTRCVDDNELTNPASTLPNVGLDRGDSVLVTVTGARDECGAFSVDVRARYCGDGVHDEDLGEACDDGNLDSTDGCVDGCVVATCGDGYVRDGVEACDDGEANSDSEPDACRTSCALPSCGDGVRDAGEQCDDGDTDELDQCSNTCIRATCEDGVRNQGELGVDCGGPCTDECVPTWSGVARHRSIELFHGWSTCYLDAEDDGYTAIADIEAACGTTENVIIGCRANARGRLEVAVQLPLDEYFVFGNHDYHGVRMFWRPFGSDRGESLNPSIGFFPATTGYNSDEPCPGPVDSSLDDYRFCQRVRYTDIELDRVSNCGNEYNGDSLDVTVVYMSRNTSDDTTRCGNGIVEAGEDCDDNNGNDFDACPNDCSL